jgi:hypothetical protein
MEPQKWRKGTEKWQFNSTELNWEEVRQENSVEVGGNRRENIQQSFPKGCEFPHTRNSELSASKGYETNNEQEGYTELYLNLNLTHIFSTGSTSSSLFPSVPSGAATRSPEGQET